MENQSGVGAVQVSNEVIGTIASIAATQVPGVAGMSGGVVDGITKLLTGTQTAKGVKVQLSEKDVLLDMSIIVNYGGCIPEIAWDVQDNVKKAIENMTGLRVIEVNVSVQGIHIETKIKEEKKKTYKNSAPVKEIVI